METAFKAQTEKYDKRVMDLQTQELDNKLQRLSMSPLPPAHSQVGHGGVQDNQPSQQNPDVNTDTGLHGVSSLVDKLSKLRPEYYCDQGKSFGKNDIS